MKRTCKLLLARILWHHVALLRKKHNPVVVAVAGSIGKTGTKRALVHILGSQKKVLSDEGNYNDLLSVPLVFFDLRMPSLYNPLAWLRVLLRMRSQIAAPYPYEVVVIELGTDYKGNIADFGKFLRADIGVLTAIAPEHMEYFGTLDEVAHEESAIKSMVDKLYVDHASVDKKYLHNLEPATSYGTQLTDISLTEDQSKDMTTTLSISDGDALKITASTRLLGAHQFPALAVSAAIAHSLGVSQVAIRRAVSSHKPTPGRMNILDGRNSSLIIDDTYNSSPDAAIAALQTLYASQRTHKIAILGSMNELGASSQQLHKKVGAYCDPHQLAVLITIGQDANNWLAEQAEARGVRVIRCSSPYHAGEIAQQMLTSDTIVLAKGSQNGVFAEESLKPLLHRSSDSKFLVRQSSYWLAIKSKQFGK